MKKITMLHPMYNSGLAPQLEAVFGEALGECQYTHIGESSILNDVIANGGVTPNIRARLLSMYDAAVKTHPDIIVCTCSSIGAVAELADSVHEECRILRIDEAMVREALQAHSNIAMMATLGTTLAPSCALIERIAAEMGKEVTVTSAVSEGAMDALMAGDIDKAKELMCATAKELAQNATIILLAQASMAGMQSFLAEETGLPILSSPVPCANMLKELLG